MFGTSGLASIKPTMVQQWIKDLQTVKGLAPSTIETIYVIFASIMRGAVRDGYIRKTPCADIRLPEISATVVRLLTPGQVLALADAMPGRYALLVLIGAGAGLRQGEAFGLALDRIDAEAGMIIVDQQVIIVERRGRVVRRHHVPRLAPLSPAPHSPKACPSPRSPAGSATSRSRPPSTCTATWSPRPLNAHATRSTRHSSEPPFMCPESALTDLRAMLRRRSALLGAGESACRPGSVPPLSRSGGHPSRTAVAGSLVRSTREHRAGCPRSLAQGAVAPLLTLLRVGFTEPPQSPAALVVSYTTVSPLPPR